MRITSSLFALCLLAVGCDDRSSDPDAGTPPVDAGATLDAGAALDAGPVLVDSGPSSSDAGTTEAGARLEGVVTRSAMPRAGGVGNLYIGVFDRDPVVDRAGATAVGRVVVEDADMSASDASIPYAIDGIPPRSEPYFVTAFLDDNGTAGTDPATAGPDRGDLVVLMGFGSPSVTVSSAGTVSFDIDLNTNLPF